MRHEKELLAHPVPPCPDIKQKPKKQIDRYKSEEYIRFSAETVKFGEDAVLSVTTYDKGGAAQYRFFLLGNQYGMQAFTKEQYAYQKWRDPGVFYGAAIDSVYTGLADHWYSSATQIMYSTPDNEFEALQYLGGKKAKPGETLRLFAKREREIREAKIEERDERHRAKLRAAFEGINDDCRQEFEEWAERVPLRPCRYFFYEYTGKKLQTGVCSCCGAASELPDIKEFDSGVCPHCGTEFKFYSAKRLWRSHGIDYRTTAAFYQIINEDRIAVRCYGIGISLRGGKGGTLEKKIWMNEHVRSFLNGKGVEIERYETPYGTVKVTVDNLTESRVYGALDDYTIAPFALADLRKKFGIYAPLEDIAEHGLRVSPNALFERAKNKPQAEYLIKLGLYRLANTLLRGNSDILKKGKGKNAAEVLGVHPDLLPTLRQADPSARAFCTIRAMAMAGVKFTLRDMKDMTDLNIGINYEMTLLRMADSCSIHKALKYVRQQAAKYRSDGEHVLQEWNDYIGMAEALEMDLADHAVWMPKSLQRVRMETAKIQDAKGNEILDKRMASTAARLNDLCWSFGGLTIRPAISHGELFEEGKNLSHCVGRMNYAEKQARGETAIFFIRKSKTLDVSYVTLELSLTTWEKIQCYAKNDSYPGKQVNNFVKSWIADIVKPSREANFKNMVRVQAAI